MRHVCRTIPLTLLIAVSSHVFAERYQVSEDRFGSLRAEPVQSPPEPEKIKRPQQGLVERSEALEPVQDAVTSTEPVPVAEQDDPRQRVEVGESGGLVDSGKSVDPAPKVAPKRKLSPFEEAYLQSDVEDPDVAARLRRRWEGGEPIDATEVDEAQFIDGDALLEGRVVNADGSVPFNVTYDSQGTASVTFIDAEKIAAEIDAQRKIRSYTPVTEYRAEVDAKRDQIIQRADPKALSLLGIDVKTYFQRYAENCCQALPHADIPLLEPGRAYFFKITKDDAPFRFIDGDSRYVLVRLPESNSSYDLRVRSFVRGFDKQNISHGVFLPQLLLMNGQKELLRILAEPVLRFEEENWLKYGYLEGVFRIEQNAQVEANERFLLLNTTPDYLATVTQVKEDDELVDLKHMSTGSFEIEVLVPED